jgi:hypothetical protein
MVNMKDADNAVQAGIMDVASALSSGKLLIHDSCKHLIGEIQTYSWDIKAALVGEDKPVKKDDHVCLAASTMIETDGGPKRIDQVTSSDRVLSGDGLYHSVLAASLTDKNAEVYEMEFSNGKTLIATGNHPIYIENIGWCRVDSLRYGYIVRTPNSIAWNQLNTREPSIDVIPMQRNGAIGSISNPLDLSKRLDICMSLFTRSIMGRFLLGIAFIMSMGTHSTTNQTISLPSQSQNIVQNTPTQGLRFPASVKSVCGTLMKFALSPKNGTHLMKADDGIPNTRVKHGKPASQNERNAISAGMNSTTLPDENHLDFAQMRASPHGEDQPGSIMKGEYAGRAEKSSSQASIPASGTVPVRVVSKVPRKLESRSPVYNLLVEDSNNFFANGILTHNCDALRYAIRRIFRKAY